ncbi:Hsp20/alpha crystallin family protein [Haloarcula sp. CBA1130]|uniref:Hsp20/alpha crystallin family protein n=1 Tax=unclassified Haloarcula TaxID=2624677 RepID=UPI001248A1FB|nr:MULTISPECIES: Hsp20 family protein [unclassified Haloarcula]KAA9399729.1 Hsp20/alpha crystallin family protein [Haloarcula sp. CBA1129]KAA9401424.1 Hsp20/alpha crystallin family protein [Haloarcula sp. CBA1130]
MTHTNDPFEAMLRLFAQTRRTMMDDSQSRLTDDSLGLRMGDDSGHRMDDGSERRTERPTTDTRRGRHHSHGIDTNLHVDETDDGYAVMVDLPGFERDDLVVRFEGGILSIQGETTVATETSDSARRHSRRVAERVTVPGPVLDDDITATYHNGVLEITLPRADRGADDSNRIEIE